jgi:hypothetical protein
MCSITKRTSRERIVAECTATLVGEYNKFCAAKWTVWVQGSFNFVTECDPTVTSFQSGYRHLLAPFQLLSVILPSHVLLSLCHYIPSYSHLLCQLPAISIFFHPLKSSGGYFSSFEIDFSTARFDFSSASLFSVFPVCSGTQHRVIFPFRLSMSCLIFLVFGFFIWLFPDVAIMVLSESVNITPLTPVVGSFCIASILVLR